LNDFHARALDRAGLGPEARLGDQPTRFRTDWVVAMVRCSRFRLDR